MTDYTHVIDIPTLHTLRRIALWELVFSYAPMERSIAAIDAELCRRAQIGGV